MQSITDKTSKERMGSITPDRLSSPDFFPPIRQLELQELCSTGPFSQLGRKKGMPLPIKWALSHDISKLPDSRLQRKIRPKLPDIVSTADAHHQLEEMITSRSVRPKQAQH